MATVETVLGPIDESKIGFTLSHEHVLVAMGEDNHHYPWRFDWEATRANAVRELTEAKAGGVDTVIDLTTPDLGRDVEFVRRRIARHRREHRRRPRESGETCHARSGRATSTRSRTSSSARSRRASAIRALRPGVIKVRQRRGRRDAGRRARPARRSARVEAHGMPDIDAPLGARTGWPPAGGGLRAGRRADGPHRHRPQRRLPRTSTTSRRC